jgi:hypothetical protein
LIRLKRPFDGDQAGLEAGQGGDEKAKTVLSDVAFFSSASYRTIQ